MAGSRVDLSGLTKIVLTIAYKTILGGVAARAVDVPAAEPAGGAAGLVMSPSRQRVQS